MRQCSPRGFSKRPLPFTLLCVLLFACTLIYYSGRGSQDHLGSAVHVPSSLDELPDDPAVHPCSIDITRLRRLGLSPTIDYVRVDVNVKYDEEGDNNSTRLHLNDDDIPPIVDLGTPLPEPTTVVIDSSKQPKASPSSCPRPVTLHFPRPNPTPDASNIVFGVATNIKRLDASLLSMSHWLGGTNARIFAIIEPAPEEEINIVRAKAYQYKIRLQLAVSGAEYNARYFSLIKLLSEQRKVSENNTADGYRVSATAQWAGIIDDDTFFTSTHALLTTLENYDHTRPQYVGALSEDGNQMHMWGFMAYGGAGIFLSMPLLDALQPHFDTCLDTTHTGDSRIAHCIYTHSLAKLQWAHGLHQCDLHGDQSGFYESGRRLPLSLHHYKTWFELDISKMAAVSRVCGSSSSRSHKVGNKDIAQYDPGCMLRRYRFADDWILTNGFSVVKYSQPLAKGDISVEKTWEDFLAAVEEDYLHTLAPLRPKDTGKVSYRLEEALVEEQPQSKLPVVRQFYVQRKKTTGLQKDKVVEVVWAVKQ